MKKIPITHIQQLPQAKRLALSKIILSAENEATALLGITTKLNYQFKAIAITLTTQEIIEVIAQAASQVFGVPKEQIFNKNKTREYSETRFATVELIAEKTQLKYGAIALEIGYNDHTSVSHARTRHCELMETDRNYKERYLKLYSTASNEINRCEGFSNVEMDIKTPIIQRIEILEGKKLEIEAAINAHTKVSNIIHATRTRTLREIATEIKELNQKLTS